MSVPTGRLLLLAAVVVFGGMGALLPGFAQAPPKAPPPKPPEAKARLDLHGDPLPDQAVMRLGTVQYRFPGIAGVGFKKTGELVVLTRMFELHTLPADGSPKAAVTPLPGKPEGDQSGALSADARFAVTHHFTPGKGDGKLTVWDIGGAKPAEYLTRDQPSAGRLTFSPDGRWLVFADDDREAPQPVQVLDTAKKKWKGLDVPPGTYVERFAFSADGSRLAVQFGGQVRVYDPATAELTANPRFTDFRPHASSLSPDGQTLAVTPYPFRLTDPKAGHLLAADGNEAKGLTAPAERCWGGGFTPGGKSMWVLSEGVIREWDPSAGKWLREVAAPAGPYHPGGPVWSADGTRFAVHNNRTVGLIDAGKWTPLNADALVAGHAEVIEGVAVSPDGKAVATYGQTVRLWDAATGKPLGTAKGSVWGGVRLAFLSNSESLLSVVDRGTLMETDARTGKELRRFKPPEGVSNDPLLYDLWLSPDGKTVETLADFEAGGQRQHTRLRWDVKTGTVIGEGDTDEVERQGASYAHDARSPDGSWKAFGGTLAAADGRVKPLTVIPDEEVGVETPGAVWAKDGKRVVLFRWGGKTPEERSASVSAVVFDVTTMSQVTELGTGKVVGAAMSADGKRLATMGKDKLTVWEVATGKEVFTAACNGGTTVRQRAVAFTPDGKRLITAHGTHCLVWDVSEATGR